MSNANTNANGGRNDDARPEQQTVAFQPVPLQEQFRLRAMRTQVAMSLRQCLGQCRLALRFYVLGRANTHPPHLTRDVIADYAFFKDLRERVEGLDAALAPHSIASTTIPNSSPGSNNSDNNSSSSQQQPPGPFNSQISMTFDMETFSRIDHFRDILLNNQLDRCPEQPCAKYVIATVVDQIEKDARVARLLPPSSSPGGGGGAIVEGGWAWSWTYDDWFRWVASEEKWVAASLEGLKGDFLI